jgi:hypothetical protein
MIFFFFFFDEKYKCDCTIGLIKAKKLHLKILTKNYDGMNSLCYYSMITAFLSYHYFISVVWTWEVFGHLGTFFLLDFWDIILDILAIEWNHNN